MTGSYFDVITIPITCPHCGQNDQQRLAELVESHATTCRACGAVIDLTSEDWRTRLAEEAEIFKQIKPEPRR